LRYLQDQDEIGSLLTLKHFKTLSNKSFSAKKEKGESINANQSLDPIIELYKMISNCNTIRSTKEKNERVRVLGIDTDEEPENVNNGETWIQDSTANEEHDDSFISFSLFFKMLYHKTTNIDRLIDVIKLGNLSALLKPSLCKQSFSEMKLYSMLNGRKGIINACDLRKVAQSGPTLLTDAIIRLTYFYKYKVKAYVQKNKAAYKIQKYYRWNFNLLPWSIASIRIQRRWKNTLHLAHLKDGGVLIQSIIDEAFQKRIEAIYRVCQDNIYSIIDILLNTKQLSILNIIREQRVTTLKHERASFIQLWYLRKMKAYRFECWVNYYNSQRTSSSIRIQKHVRGSLVRRYNNELINNAAVVIQDSWRSRSIYPIEAAAAANQRKRSITLIQAVWRGGLLRHNMKRTYIFWWIMPTLQGIVRGYLFRVKNPLGRYFVKHLPIYMKSWKKCLAIQKLNGYYSKKRKALTKSVDDTKVYNIEKYKAIDRVTEKLKEFHDQPLQHLRKVERKYKFYQAAEKRRKEKYVITNRRRNGEGGIWGTAMAAPTMSDRKGRQTNHRCSSVSPNILTRKLSYHLSPLREDQKNKSSEGTPFTLSDQQSRRKEVNNEMNEINDEIVSLLLQINILNDKLNSDTNKIQAECGMIIDRAHRTVTDRQLRHELAVSQLKVVYNTHREFTQNNIDGKFEEEEDDPFATTLRMNAFDATLNYGQLNESPSSSPRNSPNRSMNGSHFKWSGKGTVNEMNMNSPKGF
jgi:hypothetical protein